MTEAWLVNNTSMNRRISKISAEERRILVSAIGQLPELQASLIILHYLHNKPLEEVGKTLQLSSDDMAIHHHAALTALRLYNEKFDEG
jgi:DNA-directed RNA polymerase specialized sigma24 family protein